MFYRDGGGQWLLYAGGEPRPVRDADDSGVDFMYAMGGMPDGFYGGGFVSGGRSREVRASVFRFADRRTLTDRVDEAGTLVLSDEPVVLPVDVELLDGAGNVLWHKHVRGPRPTDNPTSPPRAL